MSVTAAGATLYLNGGDVAPVKIVAHTGAPNATGSNLRIGNLVACSFTSATAASRQLSADIDISIPAGVTSATHFSVYNASDVCLHISPLTNPRTGLQQGDTLRITAASTSISASGVYVAP